MASLFFKPKIIICQRMLFPVQILLVEKNDFFFNILLMMTCMVSRAVLYFIGTQNAGYIGIPPLKGQMLINGPLPFNRDIKLHLKICEF